MSSAAGNDDRRRNNWDASEEDLVRSRAVPGRRRDPRLIDSMPWIASRIFGDAQLYTHQSQYHFTWFPLNLTIEIPEFSLTFIVIVSGMLSVVQAATNTERL